jgi:hypothetical protein
MQKIKRGYIWIKQNKPFIIPDKVIKEHIEKNDQANEDDKVDCLDSCKRGKVLFEGKILSLIIHIYIVYTS